MCDIPYFLGINICDASRLFAQGAITLFIAYLAHRWGRGREREKWEIEKERERDKNRSEMIRGLRDYARGKPSHDYRNFARSPEFSQMEQLKDFDRELIEKIKLLRRMAKEHDDEEEIRKLEDEVKREVIAEITHIEIDVWKLI